MIVDYITITTTKKNRQYVETVHRMAVRSLNNVLKIKLSILVLYADNLRFS